MNNNNQAKWIHRSSRAQAIADGVLVDVSATARQAGIPYPTAVTQAAFERYIRVPAGVVGQDEAGRLWAILSLLVVAIRQATARADGLGFTVAVTPSERAGPLPTSLKAMCHPGDEGEPVITILLPDEE